MLANIYRDPKKGKTFTPQDFMPGKNHEKDQHDNSNVFMQKMIMLGAAMGAKVETKQ